VIWIPESREQWEDTISEMTAVCTSAAIRRHDFHSKKPFIPPLSRDYIRDRIDIDVRRKFEFMLFYSCSFDLILIFPRFYFVFIEPKDPLFGYQIRHRNGWLQGFVLFTNFTTWTYGFHWDSMHEMAMQPSERSNKNDGTVDQDGSLARELEAQHRSGDPKREGIVFQNIAEIALLGGLGCGEYLLRMALEQMRAKGFHYVVLQATNTSKSFYEKFGFVRVGAICRYGQPQPGQTELDLPIQGYRHWTHANESEKSLEKHGGPSYMMCLKFPPQADDENTNTGTPFCDAMLRKLLVNTKPKVEPLGATTPGLRRANSMPIQMSSSCETAASVPSLEISGNHSNKWTPKTAEQKLKSNSTLRRQSSMSPYISVPPPTAVAGIIRRKSSSSFLNTTDEQKATNKLAVSKTRANNKRFSEEAYDGRNAKRRKIEPKAASSTIPPPPKDGKPLSYVEKQYHSVWLAVPPVTTNVTHSRPPPKPRGEEALSVKRNLRSLPPSVKIVAPKFPTTSVSQGSPKSSMKHPASLSKSTMVDSTGRIYYAVRGSDGKFQSSSGKKSISKSHKKKVNPEPVSPQKTNDTVVRSETPYVDLSLLMNNKRRKPKPIDKSTLRKQKVKSYPRDKLHYFNRVVRRKDSNENSTKEYFFVLHFDDVHDLLLIVPMAATGTLLGKRQGRPRYQCVIGDTDANFETVHASDYEVIRSAMIMKTPLICQEAWDIEEDEDVDFCTR
jgi:hypothetical protein